MRAGGETGSNEIAIECTFQDFYRLGCENWRQRVAERNLLPTGTRNRLPILPARTSHSPPLPDALPHSLREGVARPAGPAKVGKATDWATRPAARRSMGGTGDSASSVPKPVKGGTMKAPQERSTGEVWHVERRPTRRHVPWPARGDAWVSSPKESFWNAAMVLVAVASRRSMRRICGPATGRIGRCWWRGSGRPWHGRRSGRSNLALTACCGQPSTQPGRCRCSARSCGGGGDRQPAAATIS